jgi:hypothetical protein
VDVGTAYAAYQDKALQNLPCKRVASWMVGPRTVQLAHAFIADLASRLADRVQLTTDGHKPYKRPHESTMLAAVPEFLTVTMAIKPT